MALPQHLERLARDCDVVPYESSGPGGQTKNKTEASVSVRDRASGSDRAATESRSQAANRTRALERVWREIQRRARRPAPRHPTRPTAAAVERRLERKRRAGEKKRARRAGT